MKIDGRYPRQVLAALGGLSALGAYPVLRFGSRDIVVAAVTGAVLSTANSLAGYLAMSYALDKSFSTLMKAVIGGMGIRMAVLLGAMVVLIKLCGMNAVALVVSLLSYYTVFFVLEILFIHRQMVFTERR